MDGVLLLQARMLRNQTQSDAIRRNQTQSDAITHLLQARMLRLGVALGVGQLPLGAIHLDLCQKGRGASW